MIEADAFISPLQDTGHSFVSGVPCSFLKPFINRVIDSPTLRYVGAASEGEAVGINLGAYLAGRRTVTLCQNSGLGNTVNPLTSLNFPFKVPTLLITTLRGEPGIPDEPQHALMGQITGRLLEAMQIPWSYFPASESEIQPCLEEALSTMRETELPYALVMKKGSVAPSSLESEAPALAMESPRNLTRDFAADLPPRAPSRASILEAVLENGAPHAAIIATTGKTGRELFTLSDRPQHFYVVGGMGTASAIGLGVALNKPERPLIVLDGDGAALMKLGTLATIGAQQPGKLLHIILDNGVHDSTGGQATVSATVKFDQIAAASNYRNVASVSSRESFIECFRALSAQPGPNLIHVRIRPGSIDNLGRPTISPAEVRARFMTFLQTDG